LLFVSFKFNLKIRRWNESLPSWLLVDPRYHPIGREEFIKWNSR
jgi:hypothetical protein